MFLRCFVDSVGLSVLNIQLSGFRGFVLSSRMRLRGSNADLFFIQTVYPRSTRFKDPKSELHFRLVGWLVGRDLAVLLLMPAAVSDGAVGVAMRWWR